MKIIAITMIKAMERNATTHTLGERERVDSVGTTFTTT